jgi:hypothetical protein
MGPIGFAPTLIKRDKIRPMPHPGVVNRCKPDDRHDQAD